MSEEIPVISLSLEPDEWRMILYSLKTYYKVRQQGIIVSERMNRIIEKIEQQTGGENNEKTS